VLDARRSRPEPFGGIELRADPERLRNLELVFLQRST
jgi:hypothetical protein